MRVAVVAFGYQTIADEHVHSDVDQVHELIPLEPLNKEDISARREFKTKLQDAVEYGRKRTASYTPIGHALTLGVDILEKGGSLDGNAVIILLSDCVNEGYSDIYNDSRSPIKNRDLIAPAISEASEHNWPICSVVLNYSNRDNAEVKRPRKSLCNRQRLTV